MDQQSAQIVYFIWQQIDILLTVDIGKTLLHDKKVPIPSTIVLPKLR